MEQQFGIKYSCPTCHKIIKFPTCPNADTNRFEALAHAIYTALANDNYPCSFCH